ncbi:MAG: hypothetical protein WBP12_00715 [Candidatus Saccharimonas sp.]
MIGTPRVPEFLRVELAYSTHAMHGGGGGAWHGPSHIESLESADEKRFVSLRKQGGTVVLRIEDATTEEVMQAAAFFKKWAGGGISESLHIGVNMRRFLIVLDIESKGAQRRLRKLFIEPLLGDESLKHTVHDSDGHW